MTRPPERRRHGKTEGSAQIDIMSRLLVIQLNRAGNGSRRWHKLSDDPCLDESVEVHMSDDTATVKTFMQEAKAAIEQLESYSCTIHCHERIKGKLRQPENIFSYFKRPRSVYLRWQKGPYEGLQASHVPQRDGADKFQAREKGLKGLAGAVTFPHESPIIDKAYPHHFRTHETSLVFLVELSIDIQQKAESLEKFEVEEIAEVQDIFSKKPATKIVCRLSSSPTDGLRWLRTEFYFDREMKLPLHFKLYDFDGKTTGEYAFTDLKPNIQLSDDHFTLKKL